MRHTKEERFQQHVLSKYQIYNSIFMTLPFDAITRTGVLLPLFQEICEKGFEAHKNPTEIVASFFKQYRNNPSTEEQINLLFRFIQYIERQVVLFDAIEEPLHQVPLPIDPGRKGEGSPAVGLRRDVGPSLPLSDLTAGQPEADGPAFGVNECVDLAHKSATGTSHAAIVSSPFFPWPRVGERGHRWSRS